MEDNNFNVNNENEHETEKPEAEEKKEEATYAFRWNYMEQDDANSKMLKKKQKNGVLIYAVIVTAAFLLCFGLLIGVLLADRVTNPQSQDNTPYDTSENINNTPVDPSKKKAVIGIKGGAVNQMNGYPVAGVYVSEIVEGYDAENHLKVGDIIVGIDNGEVLSVDDISSVIGGLSEGDKVLLKVYREGKLFDVEVTLGIEK